MDNGHYRSIVNAAEQVQETPVEVVLPPHSELQELINVKQLSKMLSVKEKTIRRWVLFRQVPYHKLGALVRFNVQEIRQWYRAQRITPLTKDIIRGKMP